MNESRSKTATAREEEGGRNKILAMILFDCSEGREKENCLNALPKKRFVDSAVAVAYDFANCDRL